MMDNAMTASWHNYRDILSRVSAIQMAVPILRGPQYTVIPFLVTPQNGNDTPHFRSPHIINAFGTPRGSLGLYLRGLNSQASEWSRAMASLGLRTALGYYAARSETGVRPFFKVMQECYITGTLRCSRYFPIP